MNERSTNEDYEILREAEFTFQEQNRCLDERVGQLYTPENLKIAEPMLRAQIDEQRRKVYVALGLEEPTDEILY
jgi:uracil-DNA glycosylase